MSVKMTFTAAGDMLVHRRLPEKYPGFEEIAAEIRKGEMRFFRKWTSATIDLSKAVKSSSTIEDDLKGQFPDTAFDLSQLRKYLYGGFIFDDLEVKIYMDGPNPGVINALEAKLVMEAEFKGETRDLYDDVLFISLEPMKLDDHLNKAGSYKDPHLPGNTEHNNINGDTTSDIFRTMPDDLFFKYHIVIDDDKKLIVDQGTFADAEDAGENSKITTMLMIMLPMTLTATGEYESMSAILFPDMLGHSDLFGRKSEEERVKTGGIDYIRVTVDFTNQIFSKGHLFITENKEDDIFPKGIKLTGKRTVVYAAEEEFKRIQKKLIYPDHIRIELDNGEKVNIPKKTGIVGIKFEMKGLFKLGEL